MNLGLEMKTHGGVDREFGLQAQTAHGYSVPTNPEWISTYESLNQNAS